MVNIMVMMDIIIFHINWFFIINIYIQGKTGFLCSQLVTTSNSMFTVTLPARFHNLECSGNFALKLNRECQILISKKMIKVKHDVECRNMKLEVIFSASHSKYI